MVGTEEKGSLVKKGIIPRGLSKDRSCVAQAEGLWGSTKKKKGEGKQYIMEKGGGKGGWP